jgi:hypothetical protein
MDDRGMIAVYGLPELNSGAGEDLCVRLATAMQEVIACKYPVPAHIVSTMSSARFPGDVSKILGRELVVTVEVKGFQESLLRKKSTPDEVVGALSKVIYDWNWGSDDFILMVVTVVLPPIQSEYATTR